VLALIAEGYARWRIGEILNLSDQAVRRSIDRLCARYQCRMAQLPDRVEHAHPGLLDSLDV
jgi:phage tail protein X